VYADGATQAPSVARIMPSCTVAAATFGEVMPVRRGGVDIAVRIGPQLGNGRQSYTIWNPGPDAAASVGEHVGILNHYSYGYVDFSNAYGGLPAGGSINLSWDVAADCAQRPGARPGHAHHRRDSAAQRPGPGHQQQLRIAYRRLSVDAGSDRESWWHTRPGLPSGGGPVGRRVWVAPGGTAKN
jgi:hypothetical protein